MVRERNENKSKLIWFSPCLFVPSRREHKDEANDSRTLPAGGIHGNNAVVIASHPPHLADRQRRRLHGVRQPPLRRAHRTTDTDAARLRAVPVPDAARSGGRSGGGSTVCNARRAGPCHKPSPCCSQGLWHYCHPRASSEVKRSKGKKANIKGKNTKRKKEQE